MEQLKVIKSLMVCVFARTGSVCLSGVCGDCRHQGDVGAAAALSERTEAPCETQREEELQVGQQGEAEPDQTSHQPGETQLQSLSRIFCKCFLCFSITCLLTHTHI